MNAVKGVHRGERFAGVSQNSEGPRKIQGCVSLVTICA